MAEAVAAGPGAAFDVVGDALAQLCERLGQVDEGEVASYIPALASADPKDVGLALVSMDGHAYHAGCSSHRFTMQSVSKPFVYALVLAEFGLAEVSRWVGAEPSGEPFNAISLEKSTGRPANPMINAGAIATTALVPGANPAERFEWVLDGLSRFAGRRLDLDEEVYRSEAATSDRNRALAYLLRAAGTLELDPSDAVDTYFKQCSIRADAVDLAIMAATLANGGVNPVTGQAVVSERVAVQVLSVMATCGMYDAAGEWVLRVGLPAKSGVSGALVAASPARFGIAAYSPPLDKSGNPVRAVLALREISERFGLHMLHRPRHGAPTITELTTAAATPSSRPRRAEEVTALQRGSQRIVVVAAQGGLDFSAAERIIYAVRDLAPDEPGWIILDLERVTRLDPSAEAMLNAVAARLVDAGHVIAVVGTMWRPDGAAVYPSRDAALAACEDGLLASLAGSAG